MEYRRRKRVAMSSTNWITRLTVWTLLNLTVVCLAAGQGSDRTPAEEKHGKRVAKVFINITGNAQLAHRLWSFIDLEVEESGIQVTNTEMDADTIITGTVNAKTEPARLTLGVVHMQVTAKNKAEKIDYCASLSTSEDSELFDLSHNSVGDELRKKYPEARTVMVDPSSDMKASSDFSERLPAHLKASGFSVVTAKPADLFLRVELVREEVEIEEDTEVHEVSVLSRDGKLNYSESSNGVLSARLKGHGPEVCPDRVSDLEWLSASDRLFETSKMIARRFRQQNAKVPSAPSATSKN